jgi:quinol monooxygenase YgiN
MEIHSMLVITGVIKAESVKEIEKVTAALAARAARSRQDEGNIDYAFSVNIEDQTEIRLVEKWESEALLNAHLEIPDEAFSAAMADAKIVTARVVSNEVTEERVLLDR